MGRKVILQHRKVQCIQKKEIHTCLGKKSRGKDEESNGYQNKIIPVPISLFR
jgi:hypothetical protein